MSRPSGTAYMGGQRCPEEMRNSTRLWIRRDSSLPRDSWQPFYWLGHHSRVAVVATADVLSTIVKRSMWTDVDTLVKLQSVLRLCSGFYRSKYPTNSISVLRWSVLVANWDSCNDISSFKQVFRPLISDPEWVSKHLFFFLSFFLFLLLSDFQFPKTLSICNQS